MAILESPAELIGDVRGPSSSTDNAIARWDGTSGKILQNSGIEIDDSGNLLMNQHDIKAVNQIDGGSLDSDTLHLAANTAAMNDPDTDGKITFHSFLTFNGITDFTGTTDANFQVVSWDATIDCTGQAVVIPQGFWWTPTIQFDTAQGFGGAAVFQDGSIWEETSAITGSHGVFDIGSFLGGGKYLLGHAGAGKPPGTVYGFDSNPRIDGGGFGGTVTVPQMTCYASNRPFGLKGALNLQQLRNGAVCTLYTHFQINSGNANALLLQGGSTITTEVGLDIIDLNQGATAISIRSNDPNAYMSHIGNAGIGGIPSCKVDVVGTIRSTAGINPTSGVGLELLYAGGVGYIQAYDRDVPGYKPVSVYATNIALMPSAGNGVGVGITDPTSQLHVHEATSGACYIRVTNTTTGTTASDGLQIGYDATEIAYFFNLENSAIIFGTNGGEVVRFDASGRVGIGTGAIREGGIGAAKLAIDGANASTDGPHVQFTTASDDYPLVQLLNWSHDGVYLTIDGYYDGAWKSSSSNSNFQIYKGTGGLAFYAEAGIAQGGAITWVEAFRIESDGDILISTGAALKTYWRDSGIYIYSGADGYLDLVADLGVRFPAGSLVTIGVEDTLQGKLKLTGHTTGSANGGVLYLETAADYDAGGVPYYGLQVNEDDFEIRVSATPKLTYKGGEGRWEFAANVHLPADSRALYFGGGSDAYLTYDGTDMKLVTDAVTASDFVIDCGTQKTLELAEVVWNDINFSAGQGQLPTASQPGIVNFLDNTGTDTNIATRGFAVDEKLSFTTEYLHDVKEGSDIYFHVHFQCDDAPTGTDYVRWQIEYTITRDGATCAAVTTIAQEVAVDTQYEQVRADFALVSGTGLQVGDQIKCTLTRITATGDAYAGEAKLVTFGIHVQLDTIGSRQQYVK